MQIPPGSASASRRAAMLTPSPKDVAVFDDDVADIDADAKFDPASRRHGGIAVGHSALHLDGTAHRINHTGEFDEQAVAGRLDDATAVLGDLGIAQLSADCAQTRRACPPRPHPSAANSRQHRQRGSLPAGARPAVRSSG